VELDEVVDNTDDVAGLGAEDVQGGVG